MATAKMSVAEAIQHIRDAGTSARCNCNAHGSWDGETISGSAHDRPVVWRRCPYHPTAVGRPVPPAALIIAKRYARKHNTTVDALAESADPIID